MINENFEIFPCLKELKESLLKGFQQYLEKVMINQDKMDSLNPQEK